MLRAGAVAAVPPSSAHHTPNNQHLWPATGLPLAAVPYPRVEARCGDLITFRWEGQTPQTVAAVSGDTPVGLGEHGALVLLGEC